jgi:hypothetical protein
LWDKVAMPNRAITDNENTSVAMNAPPLASVASEATVQAVSNAVESQTVATWNYNAVDGNNDPLMPSERKEVVYATRRLLYMYLKMKPPPIMLAGASADRAIVFNGSVIKV